MNKTKRNGKRVGPRTAAIRDFVGNNPGCTILDAALATRPEERSGHMSGYAATWRAVRAGIIEALPGKRSGTYRLEAV